MLFPEKSFLSLATIQRRRSEWLRTENDFGRFSPRQNVLRCNRRYAKDHPQEAFDRLLHKRFRRAALLGKFHIVVTVAELVPCSNSSLGLLQAGAAGLKVTNAFTCQPVVG